MKKEIFESLEKIKRANPLGVYNRVFISNIELLIKLGLAAGDSSYPYVTDKGDFWMNKQKGANR